MVVKRRYASGSKVEQETVKDQVVKPASRLREGRVRIVAARAATPHITQAKSVLGRAPESLKVNHVGQNAAGRAPETYRSNHKDHQTIKRDNNRRDSHRSVGNHSIECSFPEMSREQKITRLAPVMRATARELRLNKPERIVGQLNSL